MQEHFDAIYRDLLHKQHEAARRQDGRALDMRNKLFRLIEALREAYPDEAANYEQRHS